MPRLFPACVILLVLSISGVLDGNVSRCLMFGGSAGGKPVRILSLCICRLAFNDNSDKGVPFSAIMDVYGSFMDIMLLFVAGGVSG